MSALTGIFHRSGAPADEEQTQRMLRTLSDYAPGKPHSYAVGPASVGAAQFISTPEARHAKQPLVSRDHRFIAVFDLRLDNRGDIIAALNLGPESKQMSDEFLALHAWEKWGDAALLKMVGPLAMVLWDTNTQTLVLARDPSGQRMLHYHMSKDRVTVASLPRAIHTLGDIPRQVDELKIIDALTQHNVDVERTYFVGIHQVAPGALVRVSRDRVQKEKWYSLRRQIKPITYARDDDYVEAAKDLLDTCVAAHMRSVGTVGSFMSGGLDSSTIAATAALKLQSSGKRLPVYTSVPDPDWTPVKMRGSYTDETPHVQAIAAMYPNMDLTLVNNAGRSVFEVQEAMLQAIEQPIRNALNVHWIHEILRQASNTGVTTMLEGGIGNLTLSYSGVGIYAKALSHGHLKTLARLVYQGAPSWPKRARLLARQGISPLLPNWVRQIRRAMPGTVRRPSIADLPVLVSAMERRGSIERAAQDGFDLFAARPRDYRGFLMEVNERYYAGTATAFLSAARSLYGIEMRDPLADRRMQEWCFGVPHEQFILDGESRSLMKRLSKGMLPDDIRLQQHGKGRQSPDAHFRLSRDLERINEELARLSDDSDINTLVDVERLKEWVEHWPDEANMTNHNAASGRFSVMLPLGLHIARFIQRENGRN